jgi:hypothetical protein
MSANTMIPKLSWENCNRNRPAFRHAFQDTGVEEFVPDRHEFILSVGESKPTGRIRLCPSSLVRRDILTKNEETVWSIHGEIAFHV